jgi:hypothetical protein
LLFFIAGIVLPVFSLQLDYLVDETLRNERDALQTKVAKMQDNIKSVAARIKDIKAKGSVVVTGGGNIVNISSAISDSFNAIKHDDLPSLKCWQRFLVRSKDPETRKPVRRGQAS